jgi:hypothetical protein
MASGATPLQPVKNFCGGRWFQRLAGQRVEGSWRMKKIESLQCNMNEIKPLVSLYRLSSCWALTKIAPLTSTQTHTKGDLHVA